MMMVMRSGGDTKKSKQVYAIVQRFIESYQSMKLLARKYPWFKVLLMEILKNKKYGSSVESINTKLNSLESSEARRIGAAMIPIIASSVNESTGVQSWMNKYVSMKELCEKHEFVVPLMTTIATRINRKVDWKMKLQAILAGGLSLLDVFTDIYMIYFYYSTGKNWYGAATISCLLLSLFLQCFFVLIAYKSNRKAMLRELFYTVTFVKAGNAQLQVLKGEKNQDCSFDPEHELMIFKGCEIFAESIPGTVL
jgi:hypothetical protein